MIGNGLRLTVMVTALLASTIRPTVMVMVLMVVLKVRVLVGIPCFLTVLRKMMDVISCLRCKWPLL